MDDVTRAAFDVLGLSHDATIEIARDALARACMSAHPDKGGTTEAFVKVTTAFERVQSWIATRSQLATTANNALLGSNIAAGVLAAFEARESAREKQETLKSDAANAMTRAKADTSLRLTKWHKRSRLTAFISGIALLVGRTPLLEANPWRVWIDGVSFITLVLAGLAMWITGEQIETLKNEFDDFSRHLASPAAAYRFLDAICPFFDDFRLHIEIDDWVSKHISNEKEAKEKRRPKGTRRLLAWLSQTKPQDKRPNGATDFSWLAIADELGVTRFVDLLITLGESHGIIERTATPPPWLDEKFRLVPLPRWNSDEQA